jgi:multiple sugar transport system ATP-binding protein
MRGVMQEVDAVATQLQIEALLGRKPAQLSGGQRQRVALGRAMVRRPAAFLMDEPLSNLDAKLRVHMRSELADLHARLGATFIYVTHDQIEAMTMSNRVAMMDNGAILQLGRPSDLYARPATVKVAQFIGTPAINLLPARVGPQQAVELFGMEMPIRVRQPIGMQLTLGIRPESISATPVGSAPRSGQTALVGRLHRSENLGAEHILHVDLAAPASGSVTCKISVEPDRLVDAGRNIAIAFSPSACHVFDADGWRVTESDVHASAGADLRAISAVGS